MPRDPSVGAGLPAKAVCQALNLLLHDRFRRRASSHIGSHSVCKIGVIAPVLTGPDAHPGSAQRPMEFALALFDRHIVDAGKVVGDQAVLVEFPVFVAVGLAESGLNVWEGADSRR